MARTPSDTLQDVNFVDPKGRQLSHGSITVACLQPKDPLCKSIIGKEVTCASLPNPKDIDCARMDVPRGKTCILCMASDACKMGQGARTEPNRMMAVRVGAASLRKILGLNVNPYWD